MADVIKRVWRSGPRKVKRVAWGYTLQRDGKQIRKFDSAWTPEDAQNALAAGILERDIPQPAPTSSAGLTFGEAIEKYLGVKEAEGKRSIRDDRQNLGRLKAALGGTTPLGAITSSRVADYKVERAKAAVKRDGEDQSIAPATINRELASLRHLLRLAVEEWQVLDKGP